MFFEENIPHGRERCSIKDGRYFDLLQQQIIPALQKRKCLETAVFMQDAAPPHIARPVQAMFQLHFGEDQVISRSFPTAWPPRFSNLYPCVFWFWGFRRDCVYGGSIQNLLEFKASITLHFAVLLNTL
ncbi:hypothetical protein AVEN_160054-1 [Araneus ventricosus]|uniref:Tc1-like transposase DDE domain-containing protein n=1 Tax=Araneus ventricosus TaxID=182803 RepID=A0A4Y2L513_ARAVE|nr:hypothetical protein AVEN_160054-1 [Araneus ventricosus]